MNAQVKLLAIKSAIYQMGLRFNQEPSDAKITAYAKDLMEYTPEQITFAFRRVIDSGSAFFPSLAEILKHLRPANETSQDLAPQIATEMLNALRTYGPHAELQMLENVSENARLTFLALGYTGDIRNSENIDTVRAQLERLARGVLNSKEAAKKNETLGRIGIDVFGKVLPLKRPEMQKLTFENPSEGA
jgi:hypothetical protein